MSQLRALVMHHEEWQYKMIKSVLEKRNFEVVWIKDKQKIEEQLNKVNFSLAIVQSHFIDSIELIYKTNENATVIGYTSLSNPKVAIMMVKNNVSSVLFSPIDESKLNEILADIPELNQNINESQLPLLIKMVNTKEVEAQKEVLTPKLISCNKRLQEFLQKDEVKSDYSENIIHLLQETVIVRCDVEEETWGGGFVTYHYDVEVFINEEITIGFYFNVKEMKIPDYNLTKDIDIELFPHELRQIQDIFLDGNVIHYVEERRI